MKKKKKVYTRDNIPIRFVKQFVDKHIKELIPVGTEIEIQQMLFSVVLHQEGGFIKLKIKKAE